MPTWIMLLLIVTAGLMVLFALRFFRARRERAAPPNLNHSDRSQDVTTSDAAATTEANKATGEMRAAARVDGHGVARASAEVGHEFQYTGRQARDFRVLIDFSFSTRVQVGDVPARAETIVNAILVPDSRNFSNDVQTVIGEMTNPPGGGSSDDVAIFNITLNPNQSFTALVAVSAKAEAPDPNDAGVATAEAVARIKQIVLTPR